MRNATGGLIFILLFALISFICFKVYEHDSNEAISKAESEFSLLKKADFLNSNVKKVYCPPELRCATPPAWVVLNDDRKISINANFDVEDKVTLSDIISAGDSLVKAAGSDTLFVFENGKMSSFLIK
jgi:hypothetical protein